ncbi:hypothetical protein KY314_01400 [Candidatus Woesearchaeota archaeon]|nr:hypothetical protein [Candidatus Woesearchaeota archaeon]
MLLKYFILGIFVKIITGLDDTITHIPILASVTKKHLGRIAFSIGTLLAIIIAILFSILFISFIKQFEYYRYISAALLFILAIMIYFDIFVHRPRKDIEKKIKKKISIPRFSQLLGVGFLASIATVIDDIIAYSALLAITGIEMYYAIAGILFATMIEIFIVIYFSKKVAKIKYKEQIASLGLIILSILVLIGIV